MEDWNFCQQLENIQGTEEWKKAKLKRIGGTSIGPILRISPYKTRRKLWEEMTGLIERPDISHLPHIRRGVDAEPVARKILEEKYGVTYETPVLFHPVYKWATCSLDGICEDHILEIKTMSLQKHLEVASGIIPDYYECQVQWGLMISGKEKGLFASYRPEDGTMHEVWIPSDESRQSWMLNAAVEFMEWVEKKIEPPEDFILDI